MKNSKLLTMIAGIAMISVIICCIGGGDSGSLMETPPNP